MHTTSTADQHRYVLKQLTGRLNPILLSLYAMLSILHLLIDTHLLHEIRNATVAYSHLRSFNAARA